MIRKLYIRYMVALLTSLSYSVWYILSNMVVTPLHGTYSLIAPLFLIMAVSSPLTFLLMMTKPHRIGLHELAYPVLAGAMYTLGNLVFYFIINSTGVSAASSFASAEIVIFTLMLTLSTRNKHFMSFYYIGSVFVAAGMVLESLKLSGNALVLNASLISEGLLLAVIYGLATYFYYLSTTKVENKFTVMFFIQFTEVLLYGALMLAVYKSISFSEFTVPYTLLVAVVGIVLMASFYLETTMMKLLIPLGKGAVSTGYILSDLQLLPVLAYALIINTSSWVYYAPGMFIITVGMALLEWR